MMTNEQLGKTTKDLLSKNLIWVISVMLWVFSLYVTTRVTPLLNNLDQQDSRIASVEAKVDDLQQNGSIQAQLTASDVTTIKSDLIEIKDGIKELNANFLRHVER